MTAKNLPVSEQPYEKCLKSGAASLSDAELLAVIIRCGTNGSSSTEVAKHVLSKRTGNLLGLYQMSLKESVSQSFQSGLHRPDASRQL